MPDLNKQTLINLLIDSPLREPIKINLIDIVNNTSDVDLPKIYPTIAKELEIYSKATERRLKLAEEISAKLLGGQSMPDYNSDPNMNMPPTSPQTPQTPAPMPNNTQTTPQVTPSPAQPVVPATDGPELPPPAEQPAETPPAPEPAAESPATIEPAGNPSPTPSAPPMPGSTPPQTPDVSSPPAPSAGESDVDGDEEALAEIQKELDSLKSSATTDAQGSAPTAQPTE